MMLASHFLTSRALGSLLRVLAIVALVLVWVEINREFEALRYVDRFLFTVATSVPFFVLAAADVALSTGILFRRARLRASWTFTIRDLLLLTAVAAASMLPVVAF